MNKQTANEMLKAAIARATKKQKTIAAPVAAPAPAPAPCPKATFMEQWLLSIQGYNMEQRMRKAEDEAAKNAPIGVLDMADGVYTLSDPRGNSRTLKLATQSFRKKFMPGQQLISIADASAREGWMSFGTSSMENGLKVWYRHRGTDPAQAGQCLVSMLMSDTLGKKLVEAGYTVAYSEELVTA